MFGKNFYMPPREPANRKVQAHMEGKKRIVQVAPNSFAYFLWLMFSLDYFGLIFYLKVLKSTNAHTEKQAATMTDQETTFWLLQITSMRMDIMLAINATRKQK